MAASASHSQDPYGSSKRAIDVVIPALNEKLNAQGVRCYTTCPGTFMSQLMFNLLPRWVWLLLVPLLCLVG